MIFDPTVQTCLFDESWSPVGVVNRHRRLLDDVVNREGARRASMSVEQSTAESVVPCNCNCAAATSQKETRELALKAFDDKV